MVFFTLSRELMNPRCLYLSLLHFCRHASNSDCYADVIPTLPYLSFTGNVHYARCCSGKQNMNRPINTVFLKRIPTSKCFAF